MNKTIGEMTLEDAINQARTIYTANLKLKRRSAYIIIPVSLYLVFSVSYWWGLLLLPYVGKHETLSEHLERIEQIYYRDHGHGGSKEEVQDYLDSLNETE